MEIHQLEYFLAVEKYRSFSVASMEICVSQSTLSQQIKKLEEELGVQLFIRNARSVRLTPAGKDFLVHARRIVSEIQQSRESMEKYTKFEKGFLKIGTVPSMSYIGLNKLISEFMKSYPGICLEIYEGNTDDLLKWMQEKKVNVAFVNSPFADDCEVDFYPLVKDRIVTFISAKHPLAHQPLIDLKDLANEKFLLLKSSSWFRIALVQACNEAGYEPQVLLEDGNADMVRSFVEEGMGVAFMKHRMAQSVSNANTSIVPIRQTLEFESGLAVPRYSRLPLATRLFRDFIQSKKETFSKLFP